MYKIKKTIHTMVKAILLWRGIKMNQIKLSDKLFSHAQQHGEKYLLYLDVDRLMAPCYEAAGMEPKNEKYGGWESTPIAGHSIGHWLSATATMYAVTKKQALYDKLKYAVEQLAIVQDEEGYVSGFSKKCFQEVFTGDFEVSNFSLGGSWVPWYSIHKIYAGLIDTYQLTGMEKALDVVIQLADWAYNGLINLNNEQFQRMLISEHGGMNEAFADLYLLTDNPRYLELAERFYHEAVLDPLSRAKDDLEGKHANTQIPKVIGVAKLYNITKKEKYKRIATFFWDQVITYRTYVIGGNSIREHFGPENAEKLGITTTETCNTYNMLKLTELLFDWSQESRYMDFYEQALYNHILASQDPISGMKTYFVSTEPGHFKVYNSPDHSFWCCTGTGMENPARYNRRIFHELGNVVYVNLFIAAEGSFDNGKFQIEQATDFPNDNHGNLTIVKASGKSTALAIRLPKWANGNYSFTLNGKVVDYKIENGYAMFNQLFSEGDVIRYEFEMEINLYKSKDDNKKQAFLYGPIVLAGALGKENFPKTDILEDHQSLNNHPLIEVPTIVTNDEEPEKCISRKNSKELIFETKAIGQPGNQTLTLLPFYSLHHQRYTIYWDVMNEEEYIVFLEQEKKSRIREQEITVDVVTPNEQQPEVDHHLNSKNSTSGYLNEAHRGFRDARDGGYFQYKMKVEAEKQMYLYVNYFGSDSTLTVNGEKMEREFTIHIDDVEIATQELKGEKPGELINESYSIPMHLTNNKKEVNVAFKAPKGKVAGGVYGIRILKEPKL